MPGPSSRILIVMLSLFFLSVIKTSPFEYENALLIKLSNNLIKKFAVKVLLDMGLYR